jgi:hypothetical protein
VYAYEAQAQEAHPYDVYAREVQAYVSARLGNSSHELATAAVLHRIFAGVTLVVVTTSSSVSPWIVQRQLKWPGNAVINRFTYLSARQG